MRSARTRWRKRQDWLRRHLHLLGRIVFIDETGLNTKMARLHGRSAGRQKDSGWWLQSPMATGKP